MSSFVIYKYTLPFHPPFGERTGLLLRLISSDKQGWGEIAPYPGRSKETLSQALDQLLYVLKHPNISVSLFPSVAFGLSSAMDYRVSERPLPLCALLAGENDEILAKADAALAQGYTCAKVKISHTSLASACDLIERLSAHFSLRIDANRAFSWTQALQLAEHCQSIPHIEYIEEPTYEIDRLDHFPFAFALDESLIELEELPKSTYFRAVIFKPSILLGTVAKAPKRIFSSCCETGVGILGIASLAASLSLTDDHLGLDTYRFLLQDVLAHPLDFSSGLLIQPPTIEVDTQRLVEIAHG
jgi:o-succinylbenzoate synthase